VKNYDTADGYSHAEGHLQIGGPPHEKEEEIKAYLRKIHLPTESSNILNNAVYFFIYEWYCARQK
jgi:hypothetical protein